MKLLKIAGEARSITEQLIEYFKLSLKSPKHKYSSAKLVRANKNAWSEAIEEPTIEWTEVALITLALNLVTDLMTIVHNPHKAKKLKELHEKIKELSDYIDGETLDDEFESFELVNMATTTLYTIIGES